MFIPVRDLSKLQTWSCGNCKVVARSIVEVYQHSIAPCWVHFNLMMKTVESVKASVPLYQSARIPEDNSHENVVSQAIDPTRSTSYRAYTVTAVFLSSCAMHVEVHHTVPVLLQLFIWRWAFRFESVPVEGTVEIELNLTGVHCVGLQCVTTQNVIISTADWASLLLSRKSVLTGVCACVETGAAQYLSRNEFRREIKLTQESGVNCFNFSKLVIRTCTSLNIVREIKSGEYQFLYYLGHI